VDALAPIAVVLLLLVVAYHVGYSRGTSDNQRQVLREHKELGYCPYIEKLKRAE
jgi:hypothetical protein